jgi:L-2-hydroxyglutarate oxidase
MSLPKACNILIIGGGVVGLAIARALRINGVEDIVVIEKEASVGLHASGRNSGVMHAR